MTAEELEKHFNLLPHIENGSYIEKHYPQNDGKRPASGLIYYHVGPGEKTMFHRIDCDEYWSFCAGTPLEIWIIENGNLETVKLGIEKDCKPAVLLKKGVIFASRNTDKKEGTFLTCITVPRFLPSGFEMFDRNQVAALCPKADSFFN